MSVISISAIARERLAVAVQCSRSKAVVASAAHEETNVLVSWWARV